MPYYQQTAGDCTDCLFIYAQNESMHFENGLIVQF